MYVANPQVTHRFFPPGLRRAPVATPFPAIKRPGTVRIFVLGASTLVGFPNPAGTGFPRFLELLLADVYPEQRFEVVNCGVTAVNSHCLLDFAGEVLGYDADLLIIYAGHNEFAGPYGPSTPFAHVGNARPLIRSHMFLQRSHLYSALQELSFALPRWLGQPAPAFNLQLVTRQVGVFDEAHARTVDNFRDNLADILTAAAQRKVPVLLGTLVSNLKDFYPLRSACGDAGGAEGQQIGPRLAGLRGHTQAAENYLRSVLQEAPECAAAHFELGRLYLGTGRLALARAAFVTARDLDRLPLRAPSILNQVIRETGRSGGSVLVRDVEAAFSEASPDGIVGNELLTEYLHPTVRGHYVLGRNLVDGLSDLAAAPTWGRAQPSAMRSFEQYQSLLGTSGLSAALARNNLILFLINMPYASPPMLLRERVADLIEEQLDAVVSLPVAQRQQFLGRGGAAFLEQATSFAPGARQHRLQSLVGQLQRDRI
jgi:lysophospholipase L1-like esterase